MSTTGSDWLVTSACIILLPLDQGWTQGRTRLALAFPIVVGADLLHSGKFSSAGCATRPTGLPSAPAEAPRLGSTAAEDSHCGRKWNTSASARMEAPRTPFECPSVWSCAS